MLFIYKKDEEIIYPYTIQNLIRDNPGTSFPPASALKNSDELLEQFNVFKVAPSLQPVFNVNTHKVVEGLPTLVNGVWTTTWTVEPLSAQELAVMESTASEQVRAKRNQLLATSDWTQLPDATANKEAWATYRQALRDITSQAGYPFEVEWPTLPQ